MEQDRYKTINKESIGDFRDRGSKFLAYAFPIATVEETKQYLTVLKKEHPKAVHHCFAYRIGFDKNNFRANDDGEPSGSAGKPILGQIDSLGLTNVFVVVVRYFGGTLLGVPGLINAYKTATHEALSKAEIIEKLIEQIVIVECDYSKMSESLYLLKQAQATIIHQEQLLFCTICAGIPKINFQHCFDKLSKINGVTITLK